MYKMKVDALGIDTVCYGILSDPTRENKQTREKPDAIHLDKCIL